MIDKYNYFMSTYEIKINDRDLDNYPENTGFKELPESVVNRAVQIVYNNHFKEICEILSIEHFALQSYWIITVEVKESNLQLFVGVLQYYRGGNMSHYHCL